MKIQLNKSIIGYKQGDRSERIHAHKDDILPVIFRNNTHFICESLLYPNQPIAIFNSQCEIIEKVKELVIEDMHEAEKYYHVYEEPSDPTLYDSFYTAFEHED